MYPHHHRTPNAEIHVEQLARVYWQPMYELVDDLLLGNIYNYSIKVRGYNSTTLLYNRCKIQNPAFCYAYTLCTTQSALTIAASKSISASSSHATILLGAASCFLCMLVSHLRFASESFSDIEVRHLKDTLASTDFGFMCKLCITEEVE